MLPWTHDTVSTTSCVDANSDPPSNEVKRHSLTLLQGPPESVVEMGSFMHACEGEMIVKSTNEKVRTNQSMFLAPACLTSGSSIDFNCHLAQSA